MTTIMKTFTGKTIDLDNFTKDDIDLRDISVSLSRQNRYAGHTVSPWSVGKHLILISMLGSILGLKPREMLALFLHDVHETWIQDIISPIKHNFTNYAYNSLQGDIDNCVYDFFGVKDLLDDDNFMNSVHILDLTSYYIESNRLRMFTEDSHFEFDDEIWKAIKFFEDTGFVIPKDLIDMSDDDVAQHIFEILTVSHTEKKLGEEISDKGAFTRKK